MYIILEGSERLPGLWDCKKQDDIFQRALEIKYLQVSVWKLKMEKKELQGKLQNDIVN